MFENKTIADSLSELKTSQENGFKRAKSRRERPSMASNKLEEKKGKERLLDFHWRIQRSDDSDFGRGRDYLDGPWLLKPDPADPYGWVADVVIIFGVLILNAIIGTIQETKAEKALEALKKLSSPTATVRRDGKIVEVKAEELVPGDIVILGRRTDRSGRPSLN
jgi:Ca2+-transporting ATPase